MNPCRGGDSERERKNFPRKNFNVGQEKKSPLNGFLMCFRRDTNFFSSSKIRIISQRRVWEKKEELEHLA